MLGMDRLALLGLALPLLWGCNPRDAEKEEQDQQPSVAAAQTKPKQPIRIDGSSTVHPISEGILDLYASRLVTDIDLQFSGTGGGFRKFCKKETDINAASRPIKSVEDKLCEENGVSYIELPVAFDGVAVVVSKDNDWVDTLTTSELKKIWEAQAEGSVLRWNDVRKDFPDQPLDLYGPGLESGTFDFFTSAINGSAGNSRADYFSSEDDHEIVQKMAEDKNALAYFGLAYYQRYSDQLKLIAIDDENDENGKDAVLPSAETVSLGEYQPLSRPLFLYVNESAVDREEVRDFVDFYLKSARLVAPDVGAVGLTRPVFSLAHERLKKRQTGSAFSSLVDVIGITITDLMMAEQEVVAEKVAPKKDAPKEQIAARPKTTLSEKSRSAPESDD